MHADHEFVEGRQRKARKIEPRKCHSLYIFWHSIVELINLDDKNIANKVCAKYLLGHKITLDDYYNTLYLPLIFINLLESKLAWILSLRRNVNFLPFSLGIFTNSSLF